MWNHILSKGGPSWSWLYGIWIYNYLCNQCLIPLKLWIWIPLRWGVLDTILCDKVCQWLAADWWFSPGTPVSSTNKTDRHDITEKLLKVAYSTITLTPFYQSGIQCGIIFWGSSTFHSCKENQEEKNEMWKVRNIKWNLSKSLKIPESCINQIISQCSKSLLIKLCKPNTFLFWTQKLVPVRFGLDRFHWRKQMSCKL